jgi:acetylornithine/succinyldiaminopimelate/putrescine aminotransferase
MLLKSHEAILAADEATACKEVQKGFLQFYDVNAVNPYIPIAAKGPWMITSHGAVMYDTGGYGMLGLGQNPDVVAPALNGKQVIANIMTPSFSQINFQNAIRKEIGHTRGGVCPYESFICINSGSESVTLAMRMADTNSKKMTAEGAPHAGRKPCIVSLKGSFHGRTERPAYASDSTMKSYKTHLKSFEGDQIPNFTVEPNNIEDLERVFADLLAKGFHPEIMLMEPCMGEGNPGQLATPEFYKAAREITKKNHSLLLVDSIQAGLRAQGVLSVVDYPGFQGLEAPDFETYSKALNSGQYPMSVLAMGPGVADIYARGLYGNTMTTNPKGLDVACSVLNNITPELRQNIIKQGENMVSLFDSKLKTKYPNVVDYNKGSGMLFACHIKEQYKAFGSQDSLEVLARKGGLGTIHGGKNALRFTPVFTMTNDEADLVVDLVDDAIAEMLTVQKP